MCVTIAIAGVNVTFAQDEPNNQANEVKDVEKIVITGSRIQRKDYSSSSPVATVDGKALKDFGAVTVEETLNSMPQFIAGSNSSTVAIGGGGGATLNLRALGPTRNLVLLDQRRMPTSTPFGEVDVNAIPSVALKGVEVLTGGASAVYGSEAISGVVNFQTVDYFNGAKFNLNYGVSGEGDGDKKDMSVLFGSESDDGGTRAILALGQSVRERVRGWDRSWSLNAIKSSFIGQGVFRDNAVNPVDVASINNLFTDYGTSGDIVSGDRLGFNDDGSLFTQGFSNEFLNYKGPDGDDTLYLITPGGIRMPVGRQGDIAKPLERSSIFSKAEFDLNGSTTVYGQFLYSGATTEGTASRNLSLFGPEGDRLSAPVTNPFIPTDLANLLTTRADPNADLHISKRFLSLPDRMHIEEFETTQFVFGVKGYLDFGDLSYDIFMTKDSVNSTENIPDLVLSSRVNDLLDAPDGGVSLCAGGYNPFGLANEVSLSAECQQYIAPGSVSSLETDRTLFEATVTGYLFDLPEGGVQFSLTASHRKDELRTQKDISIQSNDALGLGATIPTQGATETTELGGELLIPLLEEVTLTAGYRISDQDVTGDASSWSLGLEWTASDTVFVRGSLQQAVRAPNVGELFTSPFASEITVGEAGTGGDPCDSRNSPDATTLTICAAQGANSAALPGFQHGTTSLPLLINGNENLEAETADTLTVGVVWQPELDNQEISITLDYWQIEVEDVINPVGGSAILDRCYNSEQNPGLDPNNQFCQLISRDSAGNITEVNSTFLNLAAVETSGIDIQVNHSFEIGSGSLRTNAFIGFLNSYDVQGFPGEDFVDEAGTVNGNANRAADNNFHPEVKLSLSPTYEFGDASIGLRWRYTSAVDDLTGNNVDIDSYSLFDMSASYKLSDELTLKGTVSNLADKNPPEYGGEDLTRSGSYDVIGRFFSIGVSGSF